MKNIQITFAFFFLLATWILAPGAVAQTSDKDLSADVVVDHYYRAADTPNPSSLPYNGFWYSFIPAPGPISLPNPREGFHLEQNYPNPFRLMTTIEFELPKPGAVTLSLMDQAGREVLTLMEENRDAGIHQISFSAIDLAGGLYFYRLVVRDPSANFRKVFVASKKLMLLE